MRLWIGPDDSSRETVNVQTSQDYPCVCFLGQSVKWGWSEADRGGCAGVVRGLVLVQQFSQVGTLDEEIRFEQKRSIGGEPKMAGRECIFQSGSPCAYARS